MYSQNDEAGVLEVLEIKVFLTAQLRWADVQKIFWKFFGFTLWWCHLWNFLEKKVKFL